MDAKGDSMADYENIARAHMGVYLLLWYAASSALGYISRSDIAGLYSNYCFSSLKNLHTGFYSG